MPPPLLAAATVALLAAPALVLRRSANAKTLAQNADTSVVFPTQWTLGDSVSSIPVGLSAIIW